MRAVRNLLIACAIVAFTVPAMAQEKKADPHAKPATTTTTTSTVTTIAAIGKPAPAFTLNGLDGKDVKLADFIGKIVVLEWSNAGCPFCVRHAKNKTAEKTLANFKDKGVVWVNIDSTDGTKTDNLKKFVKDNGLTAPYLLDTTGATGKAYGAKTTPHMFVIDAKGNLAYSGAIDDDADGKKEKARNYVQEAVDALLKGSAVATATTESYGCSIKYGK